MAITKPNKTDQINALRRGHYALLNVPENAGDREIREAYSRLANEPGVSGQKLADLSTAWEVLSDPRRRDAYDRWLMAGGSGDGPPAPQPPPNTLYAVLGVPADAGHDEIRQAWRQLISHAHPDRGGTHEAAARINQAYSVLSDPPSRAAYDRYLEHPDGRGERFAVSGFRSGQVLFTDSARTAYRWQCRGGFQIHDRRPGEAGGLSDPATVCRFRIEVPAGRKWSGEDRIDSHNTTFTKGVAYLDNPDLIRHYRDLCYDIEDRGAFDNGDGSEGWAGRSMTCNGRPDNH